MKNPVSKNKVQGLTKWLWASLRSSARLTLATFQNLKRVAEVWMDEYAEYIYQRRPEYRHLSAGDVVAQKKLRVSLNCKSFKWFMTKIAWDLPKFYPPVEPPAAAWGEVSVDEGAGPSLRDRARECLNKRHSPFFPFSLGPCPGGVDSCAVVLLSV